MQKNSRKLLIAIYVGIAFYLMPMFPHGGSANELTRWATAASLIEKGSFEISWTEPLIGPNVDTAKVGDKTYSNKAPGPAIIAAPVYALTRAFIGPPNASNIRVSWFAMRIVISTLPLLLMAVFLYRRGSDDLDLAILLFATPLFLYSMLLFSHVLAAAAVYFSFRLIFDAEFGKPKHLVFAGILSGFAVISEFPAVFVIAIFGIGLLLKGSADRGRRLSYFVLGGAPFAVFLLIYNNALFGSPFSMSYAHESFPEWAEIAGQGVFGIGLPSLSNAYLLLVSPSRGLLFSSPILIISAYLIIKGFDRKDVRKVVRAAAIVLVVLVICGHGAAHGGWAFGPRYLVFIIPLLLDPFFEGESAVVPEIWLGLAIGASTLLGVMPALTFPFVPPEFVFPHNSFWSNLMSGDGWFVPNAANLLGAPADFWTIIPVLALVVAALLLVIIKSRQKARFAAGIAIALAAVVAYVLMPGLGGPEDAFRRATIAERFFRPAERLNKYAETTDTAMLRRVNDLRWTIADARAYAPDDFPYLVSRATATSPTALMRSAIAMQKQGKGSDAQRLLTVGRDQFPFARCEFSTNLAVVYFTTGQKDAALAELESVQPLVDQFSRPDCLRSQFLLGSLYHDLGRSSDAEAVAKKFLVNSASTRDAEIEGYRKQLTGN